MMGLTPQPYGERLKQLIQDLNGGAALLLAQPMAARNDDVDHTYRQHSGLHYYSGITEPDCALLVNSAASAGEQITLYVNPKDKDAEIWSGRRMGVEAAAKLPGIERAASYKTLWEDLPNNLGSASRLYCEFGLSSSHDAKLLHAIDEHQRKNRKRQHYCLPIHDIAEIMAPRRQIKSPTEIERMKEAARITKAGFLHVLRDVKPGMNEKQVHGMLLGGFLENGADMEAYGSIIAGGDNATVLHYVSNNQILRDGDLLLIDAGAQFHYYACDVTRTFPVGKTFTPEQKALYEVVLAAQMACIAAAKPGNNLEAIHQTAIEVLVDGLLDLKLLKGSKTELIETKGYSRFYPHGTSHWLGMDVHDMGIYRQGDQPIAIAPGMVFTIEPGLYVQPDDHDADERFRGIGIRIEDDILITADGHEVLTAGIPKEIHELENRS